MKGSLDRLPWWLLLAVPPLWVLQAAWRADTLPGVGTSEAWGRVFVTTQVSRWLEGRAPVGVADLLAWPGARSFWPVDPVVQAVQVPLQAMVGPTLAMGLVTALLLALAGIGPYRLARSLGAPVSGGLVAGLLVQLSPYLLRNLHDMVVEVLAIGIVALALAWVTDFLAVPGRGRLALVGLGVLLVAGSSPYYAVFLALLCAGAALTSPRRWRSWLQVALVGAAACALALAPLALTEGGDDGRLGPQYRGSGYQLTPAPLVDASSGAPAAHRPPVRAPDGPGPTAGGADVPGAVGPRGGPPPGPPSKLQRFLHRVPGGLALCLGMVLALVLPGSRRAGLAALAVFAVGPGLPLMARALSMQVQDVGGPVHLLLQALPLTSAMGNPTRFLAITVLCGAVAAGLVARRFPWVAALLALGVLGETLWSTPRGMVPATRIQVDEQVLAALEGPTLVFPSGDPPSWHPDVGPKEVLFLAARAGVPVAFDYGRGGVPADLPATLRLSIEGGVPIGARAREQASPLAEDPAAWAELGMASILLLEDRLTEGERARIRAWLGEHAELRAQGAVSSAWAWPDR